MVDRQAALTAALTKAAKGTVSSPVLQAGLREAHDEKPAGTYKAPSRAGKTNLTAYLPLSFKANLRLIQARLMQERGGKVSSESLIAEALNDLFIKYDVPTIQLDNT